MLKSQFLQRFDRLGIILAAVVIVLGADKVNNFTGSAHSDIVLLDNLRFSLQMDEK